MMITKSSDGEVDQISQHIPFSREDYDLMIDTLQKQDVLTLFDREINAYDHMLYIEEKVIHKTQCTAIIDLNMFINILSVSRENHGRSESFVKLGAAFVLFCQLSNIKIEPFYALNESPTKAEEELFLFYRIDCANSDELIQVLRGELQRIPEENSPHIDKPVIPEEIFSKKLKGTHMMQVTLTKFASLCRQEISPEGKVKALISWMHQDYIHDHTALHLALYQLSPSLTGSVLKKVNSSKFITVQKTIQNALGDLLLLRYWVEASVEGQDENKLMLLATADEPLLNLARFVLYPTRCELEMQKLFQERLIKLWGKKIGEELSSYYINIKQAHESADRISNHQDFYPYDENHMTAVEAELKQSMNPEFMERENSTK